MKKERYKNEFEKDSSKSKYLIGGIVVLAIVTAVCVFVGCISAVTDPKTPIKKDSIVDSFKKPDISEFVTVWNKAIAETKYDNTHLKLNFDKYKLTKLPQSEIKKYLNTDRKKYSSLKKQLEASEYTLNYTPLIDWVDKKSKINYVEPDKDMDSYELMSYVANIVNPGKGFSNNTIDRVVQLNEFCYFFDKNKDSFYREGYTRNIKNCQKIGKILDVDGIKFRLK